MNSIISTDIKLFDTPRGRTGDQRDMILREDRG